jgi:hypothetical protein
MKRLLNSRRSMLFNVLAALSLTMLFSGATGAATAAKSPPIDKIALSDAGFKVLTATTKVQEDWVRGLPAGKIRPMQRTGKKYFIYPDAPGKQIYVGGPKEYDAYVQRHPEHRVTDSKKAAKDASTYRAKQTDEMKQASARDLSDPFLGATWADLGW